MSNLTEMEYKVQKNVLDLDKNKTFIRSNRINFFLHDKLLQNETLRENISYTYLHRQLRSR